MRLRRLGRRVVAIGGVLLAYDLALRPRLLSWGATSSEVQGHLPGDDPEVDRSFDSTRAITINAAPEAIWPWLLQIGEHRGGFYTYDWIERLLFSGHYVEGHSATRIHPELQGLGVGDSIELGGVLGQTVRLPVTALETNQLLRLGSGWSFVLQPLPDNKTRLIVRLRGDGLVRAGVPRQLRALRGLASLIDYLIAEPLDSAMVRRMLLGIRSRAEAG